MKTKTIIGFIALTGYVALQVFISEQIRKMNLKHIISSKNILTRIIPVQTM
jgi:hypothetical protein